jgi:hypothetical protein
MKMKPLVLAAGLALALVAHAAASGMTSVYAIVEKVVFEPSETNPERVQVWGAFAFAVRENPLIVFQRSTSTPQNPSPAPARTELVSEPSRGYLYFALPQMQPDKTALVRAEWAELKALAGTGQAVAFGHWMSMGGAGAVYGGQPSGRYVNNLPLARLVQVVVETETPAKWEPAPYQTNAGLVKLTADGSHAELVKRLRDALATK